ncbi:Hypothetical predicted protein [Podarcis lilfordi]|uniref:Uncharacterized protein n=1 Tax=Podarcis lilfordi TaxID=74358 RepID=A0AA35KVZ3_9SAUR|nr:Hypothetical predicted protein [Podarcis lilfordi]
MPADGTCSPRQQCTQKGAREAQRIGNHGKRTRRRIPSRAAFRRDQRGKHPIQEEEATRRLSSDERGRHRSRRLRRAALGDERPFLGRLGLDSQPEATPGSEEEALQSLTGSLRPPSGFPRRKDPERVLEGAA